MYFCLSSRTIVQSWSIAWAVLLIHQCSLVRIIKLWSRSLVLVQNFPVCTQLFHLFYSTLVHLDKHWNTKWIEEHKPVVRHFLMTVLLTCVVVIGLLGGFVAAVMTYLLIQQKREKKRWTPLTERMQKSFITHICHSFVLYCQYLIRRWRQWWRIKSWWSQTDPQIF